MSGTFGSVAVVGAGAVGLYYGSRLAAAGGDVRFLMRSDFDTVKTRGIWIESVDGDLELPEVQAFRSAEEIGPVDLVIVAWKATSNEHLKEVLGPLMHADSQVLTLQNGLGNDELLAGIVGPERVLGGLCFVCLNRVGEGHVRHTAGGRVTVGEYLPQPGIPRASEVARRLRESGVPSEAVENLEEAQWRKLVWNIPFNGLAIAEGGKDTAELLADPATEREVRAVMAEVIDAARARGLPLEDSLIGMQVERTRPMAGYRPSSLIDFMEGREVEYEAIWGAPLRQAREAGVAVPHLERLAARIRERIAGR